jgi:hypothetical protein
MKKGTLKASAKTISVVSIVLGIIGGFLLLEDHWVSRSYHDLCFAQMEQAIAGIQSQIERQGAYDEVFFWQKTVIIRTDEYSKRPTSNNRKRLQEAQENLKSAQERLEKLKPK